MSHWSKREVAPTPQTSAAGFPWPGAFLSSAGAMAAPTGWWSAARPMNNSFIPPYGAWMGASPTPYGYSNQGMATNLSESPPGGLLNFLHNGMNSFPATQSDPITQHSTPGSQVKNAISIDDGDDVRTEKRLSWTPDEDVRLVSAWLFHSNDPINGNGKKNDQYWGNVHSDYNSTTPSNRKRKIKHLRDRFQKIKRWVGFFCSSWNKATSIYVSGQSDDQLREKALQFYLDDYPKEGPFTAMHCWKIMKDEPKWLAILEQHENPNKRKLDDEGGAKDTAEKHEAFIEKERPIGTKEAKKQCCGKGKIKAEDIGLGEDMKKYMDIQAAASKRHEDFLVTQQRVSDAKVEAAKLTNEAPSSAAVNTIMQSTNPALQITRSPTFTSKKINPNSKFSASSTIYCPLQLYMK